jgi:hypothetical protein
LPAFPTRRTPAGLAIVPPPPPQVPGGPAPPARDAHVQIVPVHLRSRNTWYELDGLLAVHYVGSDALRDYEVATRAFVDRTHLMLLRGLGWVFCRVARLPPNRGVDGAWRCVCVCVCGGGKCAFACAQVWMRVLGWVAGWGSGGVCGLHWLMVWRGVAGRHAIWSQRGVIVHAHACIE